MKKLLFFSKGETCEPCVEVTKYLEEKKVKDYVKINPFEEIEQSIEYGINAVPTLVLVENGKELKRVIGAKVSLNPIRFDKIIEMYNS